MSTDPSVAATLAYLRGRRDAYERAIRAVEDAEGEAPAQGAGSTPRRRRRRSGPGGSSGVRAVLHAHPREELSPDQLADAMFANGWVTDAVDPPRAARAAANRLRRDPDEHIFLVGGRFKYVPSNPFEATEGT